jgi:hypothetical protein
VDHPFVLKLEGTFKDAHCLYMLLEYVQVRRQTMQPIQPLLGEQCY